MECTSAHRGKAEIRVTSGMCQKQIFLGSGGPLRQGFSVDVYRSIRVEMKCPLPRAPTSTQRQNYTCNADPRPRQAVNNLAVTEDDTQ